MPQYLTKFQSADKPIGAWRRIMSKKAPKFWDKIYENEFPAFPVLNRIIAEYKETAKSKRINEFVTNL